ncbi:TetR family transcriptional regulator (plasmid) [Streptomyces cadmiisoli]|uniref:TetR family transcriptional regulator n=1 Tax=Streptomyces cadmiisoli TaxID=2184053 RepID=A0A2Z4JDX9_9ACTN|nr:TetR family transcriptional regulator [Streptomyces cadmiisoli]
MVLRREEILDATVEQIEQRGIATTRITDVASSLGVSSGLIYYHFETKEQLIEATFAHAARLELDAARAVLSRPAPVVTRLKALLRLYSPTAKTVPGWRLWIDGYSAGLRDRGLSTVMQEMDEEWKRIFTALVEEGMASGDFHCADARRTVWRITLFLDGLAVQMVARRGPLKRDEAITWMREHTAAELGIDPDVLGSRR